MSVPKYRLDAIETIGRKILQEYDPALLDGPPQAVPIETIIETKFDLTLEYHMPIQGADEKEQFAILTKSFGEFIGLKNSAYVDINNCPFAPQLLNRGFANDTGLYKESGFCSYPLWTFDETVLKESGGEKYERYARAYDEYMESSFIGMMGAEDETGEEICTGMMM